MAIKMRNNTKPDAICCECGESQKEVLNMFDLCIGDACRGCRKSADGFIWRYS